MESIDLNKEIIIVKLSNIGLYLSELKPILALEANFLLDSANYKELRTLEREFQLIVDSMIEINSHIISKKNLETPDDYTNTFIILGNHNIIPIEFALKIAKVVGLRNKIVHKYDIIDPKRFILDLKENSSQFVEYVEYLKRYIE
jgi:uncharacterized protein YutE (UPF0331/DUF86 family)